MPDTMVPRNPDISIIQSTIVIFVNMEKAVEKAKLGSVKYFVTDIPSIMINTTNG